MHSVDVEHDDLRQNAMILACANGHADIVEYLIGKGSKVNFVTAAGGTGVYRNSYACYLKILFLF